MCRHRSGASATSGVVIGEEAVLIVFDERQPARRRDVDDLAPPRRAHRRGGGILQRRHGVDDAAPACARRGLRERVRTHPLVVDVHRLEPQMQVIGERLHAGIRQRARPGPRRGAA